LLSDDSLLGLEAHKSGDRAFLTQSLDADLHRKNPAAYDEHAVGRGVYAYTDDNPINWRDPTGRCPWCIGAIIGAGLDLAYQYNKYRDWSCINWGQVAGAAVVGALLGGGIGLLADTEVATDVRAIKQVDGYIRADGSPFKFPADYYDKLWNTGRPAPFLQAQEILDTATSVTPDNLAGFYRYSNGVLTMVYNPETGLVWHIL
jgi:hypothetical protein